MESKVYLLLNYVPPSLNVMMRWHWSRRKGENTKAIYALMGALGSASQSASASLATRTMLSEALSRLSTHYATVALSRRIVTKPYVLKSNRSKRGRKLRKTFQ